MPSIISMPWDRSFGIEIETTEGNFGGVGSFAGDIADELTSLTGRAVCVEDTEAGNNNLHILSNGWGVCYDGSCGFEVKSPILSGDAGLASVAMMLRAMSNVGAHVSSSCGIHIHVDTRDFREDYRKVGNLAAMVSRVEDIILACVNRSRTGNTYCRSYNPRVLRGIRNAQSLEDVMLGWYGYSDGGRRDMSDSARAEYLRYVYNDRTQHYHGTRYNGANMHSMFYRGSIEMRYFNSTLARADLVQSWIALCVATVEYAARAEHIRISALADARYGNDTIPKRFARIIRTFANGRVLGAFPSGAAEVLARRMSTRIGRTVPNPLATAPVQSLNLNL
jgi:hypothetical protein